MDAKEVEALVTKTLETALPKALEAAIPNALAPLAGQVAKIGDIDKRVGDMVTGAVTRMLSKQKEGSGDGGSGDGGTGDGKKSKREEIDTIQREKAELEQKVVNLTKSHDDLDKSLKRKDDETTLRSALGKKKWFDIEDAMKELAPKLQRAANGTLYIPTTQRYGTEDVEKKLTLDEAVEALATQKKHWIESSVQGGTGAGGSSGAQGRDFTKKPSYSQLMGDPDLLKDWQERDPAFVAEISNEAINALKARKR